MKNEEENIGNQQGNGVLPCVRKRFTFDEREPEMNAYISLVLEDGSDCECIYTGLDKIILPLPTHWYYVD